MSGQVFDDVELRTGRLLLRAPRATDIDDEMVACQDEQTQRWLPLPRPYTREHAEEFSIRLAPQVRLDGRGLVRTIDLDGRYAGTIDLKRADWSAKSVEVGYLAAPWARGRGIMTEALSALTDWVLDQGFGRVEVRAAVGNRASQRVAEKAGFRREGVLRRAGYTHDGPVDILVFSRTADDPRPTDPSTRDRGAGLLRPHPPERIRPSALVAVRRGADVLVLRATTPSGNEFLRLPGGGIEPGELALETAARETFEELGATIVDARVLGVVENLFSWGGRAAHEHCFVIGGSLAEPEFGARGWTGLIRDTGQPTFWVALRDLRAGLLPFHPAAALDLLDPPPVLRVEGSRR